MSTPSTKTRSASNSRTPSRAVLGGWVHPRGRLSVSEWVGVAVLVAIPLVIIGYKNASLPGSHFLATHLSFEALPKSLIPRTHHLLFTPLGAVVVVFARLTLGLRILGPFRSILLAIAFQITGIVLGVAFFAIVISVVYGVRPVFKRMRMPYFARSSAMLATVAGTIALAMLVGIWLDVPDIERLAFFPVVVLTLAGEAFTKALRKEGQRSALFRAGATVGVAIVITLLASISWLQKSLVRYPEMTLWCVAGVILCCEFLAVRKFQHLNPPVKKRKKTAPPLPVPDSSNGVQGASTPTVSPEPSAMPVPQSTAATTSCAL